MVAEVLTTTKVGYPVLMIGLHDEFDQKWQTEDLMKRYYLDTSSIA